MHTIVAALKCRIGLYTLCSPYYTVESWRETYANNIYPCGNKGDWIVVEDVRDLHDVVRIEKALVGRPKKPQGRQKKKYTCCHCSRAFLKLEFNYCDKFNYISMNLLTLQLVFVITYWYSLSVC